MSQCTWRMPGHHHSNKASGPLWCIRQEGHDGPHKNYTGRWEASAEYRTTVFAELPRKERRSPQATEKK